MKKVYASRVASRYVKDVQQKRRNKRARKHLAQSKLDKAMKQFHGDLEDLQWSLELLSSTVDQIHKLNVEKGPGWIGTSTKLIGDFVAQRKKLQKAYDSLDGVLSNELSDRYKRIQRQFMTRFTAD